MYFTFFSLLLHFLRYYPALKTLEQLEHTYLPRVSKYRFSQVMCETIPKLRCSIKEASMSDLKDFLESIRKHSGRIGEVAMKQVRRGLHILLDKVITYCVTTAAS